VGAARAAAQVIATIRESALKSVYIKELAKWTNQDLSEVSQLVDRAAKEKVVAAVAPLRTSVETTEAVSAFETPDLRDPLVRFERQLLEVLIQHPNSVADEDYLELISGDFVSSAHATIAASIRTLVDQRTNPSWLSQLAQSLDPSLHPLLRSIAATELPASDELELKRYVEGVVVSGFINSLTRQKLSLQAALRQADQSDSQKISEIQKQLVAIEQRRRALQGG
jgi:DNA primase